MGSTALGAKLLWSHLSFTRVARSDCLVGVVAFGCDVTGIIEEALIAVALQPCNPLLHSPATSRGGVHARPSKATCVSWSSPRTRSVGSGLLRQTRPWTHHAVSWSWMGMPHTCKGSCSRSLPSISPAYTSFPPTPHTSSSNALYHVK